MSRAALKKKDFIYRELLNLLLVALILLLSLVNILFYLSPKKVLGLETKASNDQVFWNKFLSQNPNYIPGWIETGRADIARQIDPNFQTK